MTGSPPVEAAPVPSNHTPSGKGLTAAPVSVQPDVQRARDIIAGRIQVPETVTSPAVEAALKRFCPDREPPLWLRHHLNFQERYGKVPVASFQPTEDDEIVVLAVGVPEIGALLKHLTNEELEQVLIQHPHAYLRPWEYAPAKSDRDAA